MTYILLLIGFVLLIKGADIFVDGSASIAKIFNIPSLVIGLTIVSIGTSAPEAAVSITAGIAGNNDIAISNIIGSNIFNILVVIGACALISPYVIDKSIAKRDLPITAAVSLLLLVFLMNGRLSRMEGLIFFILMCTYLAYLVISALRSKCEAEEDIKVMSPFKSCVFIIAGIAAVIIGGDLVVDNASEIALHFGLSQTLVGLTIVSIGTSLPELVTSIVAAGKGQSGLALGNAVGSCIFNILFILGISSLINPMTASSYAIADTLVLIGITLLMLVLSNIGAKSKRWHGALCIGIYILYLVYIIMR